MNKKNKINVAIMSVLSVGLLTSALTAAPLATSTNLSYESGLFQPVANTQTSSTTPKVETKDTVAQQSSAAATTTSTSASSANTAQPSSTKTSSPSRPQTQNAPSQKAAVSRQISSNTSQSASAILATAKRYIGVKYVWGGTTPSGFDCSGYTQYVFAQHGVSLPRTSRDQYTVGRSVSFSNLQPGDLVFFSLDQDKVIDHEGIYVGNGQFINASTSKGVTIYALGEYWKSHFMGAKRVL